MKSFTGYEILMLNKRSPRLFIFFHIIEIFLIQKLSTLVIADQTGQKLASTPCPARPFPPLAASPHTSQDAGAGAAELEF